MANHDEEVGWGRREQKVRRIKIMRDGVYECECKQLDVKGMESNLKLISGIPMPGIPEILIE